MRPKSGAIRGPTRGLLRGLLGDLLKGLIRQPVGGPIRGPSRHLGLLGTQWASFWEPKSPLIGSPIGPPIGPLMRLLIGTFHHRMRNFALFNLVYRKIC